MEKKLNYNVTSKNVIDNYFYFMVVEQNKVTMSLYFSRNRKKSLSASEMNMSFVAYKKVSKINCHIRHLA